MAVFNLIRVSLGQISSLDHCIQLILYTTFNHQFIFIVNMCCSCINFFLILIIIFVPIIHTLHMHAHTWL